MSTRMNESRLLTSTLAAATLFAASAAAHAFPVVGELTEESFGSDPDEGGLVFATIAVDTPANFVFDFSTVDETQVAFTWRAPAGKQIQITPPAGFAFYALFARFETVAEGWNFPTTNDNVVTDLNPAASLFELPNAGFATAGDAVEVHVDYQLQPGQTYLLSEITLTGTAPAALDGVFDSPVGVFELRAEALGFGGLPPDAGQWMTIIPEPASAALLLPGGIALLGWRRSHKACRSIVCRCDRTG